jgi:TP901 family phage tail tape measure protein
MATNTEKIVVQVVVQGDKDLKKLEGRTKSTTKSFGKMAAGVLGAVAAFKTITGAIGNAIKTFRDFEFQMSKVKAITGANTTDFIKLSKSAEDLGRTTFFTATQVAELQTNYGKLGFTTKEILQAQDATLALATATGEDLGRAATVAGAAVRGFGLDASETQRVVDVMAVSFTSSAMDLEKFQTSMTKVAPIAKSAGFSIEDTAAMMSKLTDSGIEASIAGTSMRNILLAMQDPNSKLTKSFGKTIHSYDELVPAMNKFVEEGGSMAEVMQVVEKRQAASFEQLISNTDATLGLRDAMVNSSGAASEMAGIVGDNLEGAFKRLNSAWEGLMINFTESVVGKGLQNFVDGVADLVNVVSDFVDIPMSEKLEEERIALNSMVMQLTEANIKEEDRNKLIIKIKKEYPDFLKNINTEKTSTKELKDRLKEYNSQLINKIALQIEEEKLNNISQKAGKARRNQDEAQTRLYDKLVEASEKYKFELIDGATIAENFTHVKEQLQKETSKALGKFSDEQKTLNKLNPFVVRLANANENLKEHTEELNVATEDRDALAKRLGISLDEETSSVEENTEETNKNTTATNTNTEAKKENEHSTKLKHQSERDYIVLMTQVLEGTLSQEEAERQLRENKINAITDAQNALQNESLLITENYELYMALEKQLIDLKMQGYSDDETARLKQISDLDALGKTLITMAGDEEELQGIKKLGIKVTAAATLATNLNTLANAQNAISLAATQPFPASLVAIVSVLGALLSARQQISTIFANGGMIEEFANGGMVQGKSHANGGEKFAVGGRVVELEGGEAVINKRSTSMFRNQLSAMNSAGGGVKFADGGLLNMPSFSQQQFNALGQNQMMGAMGGASKVVVVEADITSTQNSVSVIESDAII